MFEIETRNLTRNFGNLVAVNSLNLQIPKGTIFGFLGPNGAGESTTVKMLTGLLQPTAGEAIISGLSIHSSPIEVKKKIGVLLVLACSGLVYFVSLWHMGHRFSRKQDRILSALS